MKNLTITVEDNVLEWARVEAARRGTSVSRMVGDFMAEMMQREDAYERAYLAWRTDERSWQGIANNVAACNAAGTRKLLSTRARPSRGAKPGSTA